MVDAEARVSGTIPRLVMVPAWGTSDGPWARIRDAWPGPTETFIGGGLGGRGVDSGWSLATDASELADVVDDSDILSGAGWAATTVLLAAVRRRPLGVVLYSPPIGLDLLDIADAAARDPNAGREFMSAFGGSSDYWDAAVQAPNFSARVVAYLSQDVVHAGGRVKCRVVVANDITQSLLPAGWTAITAEPEEVPGKVLVLLG